eukprot:gene38411-8393_t
MVCVMLAGGNGGECAWVAEMWKQSNDFHTPAQVQLGKDSVGRQVWRTTVGGTGPQCPFLMKEDGDCCHHAPAGDGSPVGPQWEVHADKVVVSCDSCKRSDTAFVSLFAAHSCLFPSALLPITTMSRPVAAAFAAGAGAASVEPDVPQPAAIAEPPAADPVAADPVASSAADSQATDRGPQQPQQPPPQQQS